MTSNMPTNPLDESVFEDAFIDELESWFSARLGCCDRCYQKFLEIWPSAYTANSNEFQTSQIQLDAFYDGSRINSFYTKEQFERLVQALDCPRCGEKLGFTIFPYELPFDVPENFESNVATLRDISQRTPFLILENEFAREIFMALRAISRTTKKSGMPSNLFRARGLPGLEALTIDQFNFASPRFVSEGRYNHAGQPVLYLGDSKETCFHELRGVHCVVAEVEVTGDLKILDFTEPYDSHESQSDLLNALAFSSLLSTPHEDTGYQKLAYVFSRFIADCARTAGFDAILYPSTRQSVASRNHVILNADFAIGNRSKLVSLCHYDGQVSRTIEL